MTTPVTDERPSVRLYRYMKAEHAMAAIEHRELRVSRIDELNDPFEFSLAIIPPVKHPLAEDTEEKRILVKGFNETTGLICFSEESTLTDPVMWSHYSEGHKGIALGFDYLLGESLVSMTYPNTRPTLKRSELMTMTFAQRSTKIKEGLIAKAPGWSYEAERRVLIDLTKCKIRAGHYFTSIKDDFLKHVILGIRCKASPNFIKHLLTQSKFSDVQVTQAQLSQTEFKVVV